ncbi:lipid A deacylase LpxR family protein [Desertivirga brevis]|uniref:lipid A deacylase LpxR family protein n=1 Tax=Desertivirga brevis TaxID=2810310 RepID=UPI001A97936E|nr:lipid A deacylase LpxR family protein [Pedobacter sp. SYSU D00873]
MKRLVLILFVFALSVRAFSQEKTFDNEFGFRSDNDAYLAIGQDRYYTNGLFITFKHAGRTDRQFLKKKTWEAEVGQYMYNANSGDIQNLQEVDRPFAGYLYGGVKLNWFTNKESVFQGGLQVGIVGPKAYGKQVQETLHETVGFYTIHGWEYQINNESGINSSFSFSNLLARRGKNDFTLSTYLSLGSTFSGAGAGLLYRTGNLNPLFSSAMYNSRITREKQDSTIKKESFFYARPMLNFVAYNATIQGGMFTQNKGPATFKPNRVLFTQELGYTYSENRWTFNFAMVFQTKELKEQISPQQYGSVSLYYRFN